MKKTLPKLTITLLMLVFITVSSTAQHRYGEVLQKSMFFYEAQRSGVLPENNRVSWRGDACVNDGSSVGADLSKGWFDAGDNVKFNLPMAFSVTALSWGALEYPEGYAKNGQMDYLLENIRWATDYFIACHPEPEVYYYQVGDGKADHGKWAPAEVIDYMMDRPVSVVNPQTPGSDVTAETAAAMAAASMLFKKSDPSYSATLLKHARELHAFANKYRGNYPLEDFYRSWSGHEDELTWGAIWLYKATGETQYLDMAKTAYIEMGTDDEGVYGTRYKEALSWDDKFYGCYLLMAEITGEKQYKDDIEKYLDYWVNEVNRTPAGLTYLPHPMNWGSLRYSSNTAFCALRYSDITDNSQKKQDYYNLAKGIIDYILGDNPEDMSYVVGYGDKWPKNIHHRTAHGWPDGYSGIEKVQNRHILYGALVGGPNDKDKYIDDINDYIYTEVACDYNAGFTGAIARLAKDAPATALADFPIPEVPEKQIYVEMNLSSENNNGLSMWGNLVNASAWPAKYHENLAFRYYVDITEGVNAGYTAADYEIKGSGTTTKLLPWDESKNIYYAEVTLENTPIYPGELSKKLKSVNFEIKLPGADASSWDATNDWSYKGLIANGNLVYNQYMPTYEFGVHLDGLEPDGGTIEPVTGVSISRESGAIEIGNSMRLTATVAPADAADKSVTWSSDNEAIATVNENGQVSGVSAGTANITVTTNDGGFTATSAITVNDKPTVPVTEISVSPASISLGVNQSNSLTVSITPSDATNKEVTWSSKDPSIASVTNDGVISGVSEGKTEITATSVDGGHTSTATVEVTGEATYNMYTQRFLDLRAKMNDPANGYFSKDGVPYHSVETLIAEAPDHGHESTSEAYSYWIWMESMYGGVTGDWSYLNSAWDKMEKFAIPTSKMQPTISDYNPSKPAAFAAEHSLPSAYPSEPESSVPVGEDPVSQELINTYGSDIYAMHWLFDCDNFYGYGNFGDGKSTPSYINTFQRGQQESVWETVPHPSWEDFTWGDPNNGGYLKLFLNDKKPTKQWRYTNAPDADARAIQAMYWASEFAKEQGLDPKKELPLDKAAKMGDWVRLGMFDKYFKPMGVQDKWGAGGKGYESAHYLMSWYFSWGGPLTKSGWSWRIGSSHIHFGYQNPMAAYALSQVDELKPISKTGASDWNKSLDRMLEFYTWLQSDEGAIAGGATNCYNGNYEKYPESHSTFYKMAYQVHPVYHDPGSNGWSGMQAWSMERIAELYYITNNPMAKNLMDNWTKWLKSVVKLLPNRQFEIPASLKWSGQPETWDPTNPKKNVNLHVEVENYGTDLGTAACFAKALTYYAAATQKYETLDTEARDLAKELLDRMWENYYDPNGKGCVTEESRGDFNRFFDQEIFIPEGYSGKMPNGDVIEPGVKFIDIRSGYKNDPDFAKLEAAYQAGEDYTTKYHRYWAQSDIALANAEFGRLFGDENTKIVPVSGVSVDPTTAKIKVSDEIKISATVAPSNATNKAVTWTTSDNNIATVDNSGNVTGIAIGTATITATTKDGGFTASCTVTVEEKPVVAATGVTVDPTSTSVVEGKTVQLQETVLPASASNKSVSWTSSDEAVLTVDNTGLVTALTEGNATVTVTTTDGGFTATCSVEVTEGSGQTCGFDIPRASALPSSEYSYEQVYTVGNAPVIEKFKKFTINWSLENKGLYNFSFNIGKAPWYVSLKDKQSNTFAQANPTITLSESTLGIDGEYYVNVSGDAFIMQETSGDYAYIFSNLVSLPCTDAKKRTSHVKESGITKLQVFPNPFTNEFSINLSPLENVSRISVYTISGQLIKELGENEISDITTIHVGGSSSLYTIKVVTDKETITQTILKK